MGFFEDLLANETVGSVRRRIVEAAKTAELAVTAWVVGDVGEQFLAAMTIVGFQVAGSTTKMARGYASLDTSFDPGDVDPFDPDNENLEPEAGFLSNMGANTFSTPRQEATFATGFWTFDNSAGSVARTLAPGALTITWTGGSPPTPNPTYRNAEDSTIYTEPGGTVTVAAGATLELPIVAEELGTRSNAPAGTLTLTTTLSGVTGTNAAPVVGTDREDADAYKERCRDAPSRVSLSGPSAAYEYLAKTKINGDPLLNATGNQVNITRVQVSGSSATGK